MFQIQIFKQTFALASKFELNPLSGRKHTARLALKMDFLVEWLPHEMSYRIYFGQVRDITVIAVVGCLLRQAADWNGVIHLEVGKAPLSLGRMQFHRWHAATTVLNLGDALQLDLKRRLLQLRLRNSRKVEAL